MHKYAKQSTMLIIILALIVVPCNAMAAGLEEGSDNQVVLAEMVTDAIIVRPLGMATTVLGFGLFIVAVPFAALGGNAGEAWDSMVAYPAKFTFARPLGKF